MVKPTRRALTKEEIAVFLDNEPNPLRKLMWEAYLYSGARRSELLEVEGKDVTKDDRSGTYILRLNCKKSALTGIKERLVPIPEDVAKGIISRCGSTSQKPFPFPETTVNLWFRQNCKRAGLTGIVLHSFRHTYATHIHPVINLYTMDRFMETMGHKTLGGYMTYYHPDADGRIDKDDRAEYYI